MKKSVIAFILILGAVLTTALVAVDHYTAPRIRRNEELKIKTRVLEAMDIPHTDDDVESKFSESIEAVEIEGKIFYISSDGGAAFEISGSGVWGAISGILAVSTTDLATIRGITIIHQEETPGLGGRITEDEFLDGFKGKKLTPEIKILKPGQAKMENEVDGITGASLTCKAFQKLLNGEADKYLPLLRRLDR